MMKAKSRVKSTGTASSSSSSSAAPSSNASSPSSMGSLGYLLRAVVVCATLLILDKLYVLLTTSETNPNGSSALESLPSLQLDTHLKDKFNSLRKDSGTLQEPAKEKIKLNHLQTSSTSSTTTVTPQLPSAQSNQQKDVLSNAVNGTNRFPVVSKVLKTPMTWNDFIHSKSQPYQASPHKYTPQHMYPHFQPVLICPEAVEQSLSKPMLGKEGLDWCAWVLSPTGGNVVVGKSWGQIAKNHTAQFLFEEYNCNAFAAGMNPSCNDEWGDEQVLNWRKNHVKDVKCQDQKTSKVFCYDNENSDRFCMMENVQLNFDMMADVERGRPTLTRKFEKGFLSVDCGISDKFLKWTHLFSTEISPKKSNCDIVINGTTLVYSHDDVTNAGHTINDIMNVWLMMWLTGTAQHQQSMVLLNIDAFNQGHNHQDDPNKIPFYLLYHKVFQQMIGGSSFGKKTVCLQKAIFQPQPAKMFVWDSWFLDNGCSFLGPSTLFQRWNIAARHSFNLLTPQALQNTNNGHILILVIARTATSSQNRWANERTSRNIRNFDAMLQALQSSIPLQRRGYNNFKSVTVRPVSFEKMTFEDQIKLVSQASIIIGTHGAGLSLALHMSVGSQYCCGVVEIFPQNEFHRIRGHGNMLRRMGVKYDRVDVGHANSHDNGVDVPVSAMVQQVNAMLDSMVKQPACVRSQAYHDPYFSSASPLP